jgi:hypothetical protein
MAGTNPSHTLLHQGASRPSRKDKRTDAEPVVSDADTQRQSQLSEAAAPILEAKNAWKWRFLQDLRTRERGM